MRINNRFVVFEHSDAGTPYVQYHGRVLEVHGPHTFTAVLYDWMLGAEGEERKFDIRQCHIKFFPSHAAYTEYMDKHGIPAINAVLNPT